MTDAQTDPARTGDGPAAIADLVAVVDRLLDPDGCVWNRAQTHATLARYAVEESYELVDAIDDGDVHDVVEELGDVLYQVVLHAGIAEHAGTFTLADVAEQVVAKTVRRHPHVFGDERADTVEDVVRVWRAAKAREKASRTSVFDGVPRAMPPLERAVKLLERTDPSGTDGQGAADPGWGADLLARIADARAAGIDVVGSLRAAVTDLEGRGRASEAGAATTG